MPRYYQFLIELQEVKPRIWRRIQLRADATFADLHDAIQGACEWQDNHLHCFFKERSLRTPIAGSEDEEDAGGRTTPNGADVPLSSFFADHSRCVYVYDYGDDWRHDVVLEKTLEVAESFVRRILDGARAFPPEDCGGPGGYDECLEAVRATGPRRRDVADRLRWLGPWSPERFELERVRKRFDRLRAPRTKANRGATSGPTSSMHDPGVAASQAQALIGRVREVTSGPTVEYRHLAMFLHTLEDTRERIEEFARSAPEEALRVYHEFIRQMPSQGERVTAESEVHDLARLLCEDALRTCATVANPAKGRRATITAILDAWCADPGETLAFVPKLIEGLTLGKRDGAWVRGQLDERVAAMCGYHREEIEALSHRLGTGGQHGARTD